MIGPLSYGLEREPEFLALTRVQGDGGRVVVVDTPTDAADRGGAGRIVGMATIAWQRVFFQGRPVHLPYLGDLKVHPEHRGAGHVPALIRFGVDDLEAAGAELGFSLVLAGNRAMAPIVERRDGAIRFHRIASLRNYTIFFGPRKRAPVGVEVRPATSHDIPEMVALWNRLQVARDLAPVWDDASFRARLAAIPTLGIEDYRLAFRGGRLTGLVAAWDAFSMKQVRLLSLTPALAMLRSTYNPIARAFGRPTLPRDGEPLRFVYASQPCAEEPIDLRALLVHLHAERRGGPHVYVDLSLDVRDPLGGALAGFWRSSVDFDVVLLTWGSRGGTLPPRDHRPIYFDVSFV